MESLKHKSISELVAENYKVATVFNKYKIDFCCKGGRTLEEACQIKQLDIESLLNEIKQTIYPDNLSIINFTDWPLDFLADYIEKKHHRYVEQRTIQIKPLLEKLCQIHGKEKPELILIKYLFNQTAGELAKHMKKEEFLIFPIIRKMIKVKADDGFFDASKLTTFHNTIRMMIVEHSEEGDRLKKIAELSNYYFIPEHACNSFKVTYALLHEFEDDLHVHVHLENNILFPKAEALVKELQSKGKRN